MRFIKTLNQEPEHEKMDEILYLLCWHNVAIMDSWHPYPATAIASYLGLSIGKVRYHLKKLKEQGLVESFHEGGMTEDGQLYCIWGWTITEKAQSTKEFQIAYEEEKLCREAFNIDIEI